MTTIPLHLRILDDPDFVAGRLSTQFMDRFAPPVRSLAAGRVGLSAVRPWRPDLPRSTPSSTWRSCAAGRAHAARGGRGLLRRRCPPAPGAREVAGQRRAAGAGRRGGGAGPARRRDVHRQRSRRRRRRGRARRARRPGRPAGRTTRAGWSDAAALVGCSTHSSPQVEPALAASVTYVAVGPVFATATKDTGSGRRPRRLARPPHGVRRRLACRSSPLAASRWERRGGARGRRRRGRRHRRSGCAEAPGARARRFLMALGAADG